LISKISIILYCFIISSCSSGSNPSIKPTLLITGINSYLDSEQVKKLVNIDSKQWKIIENNKTLKNDKRPPYHMLVIAVSNFENLGEHGEARFYFFNNRLMSIWFYPTHLKNYKLKLEKERGIKYDLNCEAHSSVNTKIRIGKDYDGKSYVAFEDTVLDSEHKAWISRYS